MSLVQINPSLPLRRNEFSLFHLGFRPFFLAAALFAVVTIFVWLFVYSGRLSFETGAITPFEWHAHQMVYGFSMAVIAGFLLTAVMNWTNVQTLRGAPLQVLVVCWAVPRIVLLFGTKYIAIAALFDLVFFIGLAFGVGKPIVIARQWTQIGILSKIGLLGAGNTCFYLDSFGMYPDGAFVGTYGGLFLIVSLILTIGGRVMPAFVRNGIDAPVSITNPRWVALTSFVVFFVFFVNFLFYRNLQITGVTAAILCLLTSYRLVCWHAPGIWRKPLLWGLFSAYLFIDFGFFLYALALIVPVSPFIALHAFAYGGIGLATLAMMIRVSVGHTGRSIRTPPQGTAALLWTLLAGAVVRVIVPLSFAEHYRAVIVISQLLWIGAFFGFVVLFARMLVQARPDGQPG